MCLFVFSVSVLIVRVYCAHLQLNFGAADIPYDDHTLGW